MTTNYDTKFPEGDGAKKLEITEEIATEIRAGLRAAGQSDLEAEAAARADAVSDEAAARAADVSDEAAARAAADLPAGHSLLDATAHVTAAVVDRLSEIVPSDSTRQIFTTAVHSGAGNYVRNPNCWAADVPGLEAIGVWQSANATQIGFCAISSDHVVMCDHAPIPNGSTLRWVTRSNEVVDRLLVASARMGSTDTRVGVLSSSLPDTIQPAMIDPGDGAGSFYTLANLPFLSIDQEMKALANVATTVSSTSITAGAGSFGAFYEVAVTGDSGHPWCLATPSGLVCVAVYHTANTGDRLSAVKTDILAAAAGWGGALPIIWSWRHRWDWEGITNVPALATAAALAMEITNRQQAIIQEVSDRNNAIAAATFGAGGLGNFESDLFVGETFPDVSILRGTPSNVNFPDDQSVSLSPKGAGGVSANAPVYDPENEGEFLIEERQEYHVDWQTRRDAPQQVAAAICSVISGGWSNFIPGSEEGAWCPGGRDAVARMPYSGVRSSGKFSRTGDCQVWECKPHCHTTDGIQKPITYDDYRISDSLTVRPGDRTFVTVTGVVHALAEESPWDCKSWRVTVCARYDTGAITLIGAPQIDVIAETAGASAWTITVSVAMRSLAIGNKGCISFLPTGSSATTIRWDASLTISETGYP